MAGRSRGIGMRGTAPAVWGNRAATLPRLEVVYGDGKYNNRELDDWLVQRKAPFASRW